MERTMSVEDKIRRAEEIYNRRKESRYKVTNTRVSVDNSNNVNNINQRLKKMIIQIVVCMIIYFIFYYIINNNYIFSEDFKQQCEKILSYDISLSEVYKNVEGTINSILEKYKSIMQNSNSEQTEENLPSQEEQKLTQEEEQKNEDNLQEQNQEEEQSPNEKTDENSNDEQATNADENIGGAVEEVVNIENEGETSLSEDEQMKKDAEEIKEKISFIKPLQGTITSVFGWRNPTVSTVSKYHTGLDIAANTGTEIKSATDGKVVLSSSQGAYGNHLKIEIQDIIIIYAHCSSLEVKEGDEITQGQVIAKVGSTGNSTGPHLHFEIRRDERYVDPKLILDF